MIYSITGYCRRTYFIEAERSNDPPQSGICHTSYRPLKMPCAEDIMFA